MTPKYFILCLLSLTLAGTTLAQTAPQKAVTNQTTPQKPAPDEKDEVVRITTNLVQVDAVVTKDGKPVTNLSADDFELFEDGKPQKITSFAYISNVAGPGVQTAVKNPNAAPASPVPLRRNIARRTMALVVDDLGLSAESMAAVRRKLRKFVVEQLQPDDLVAIIRTGGTIGALQQFTNDRRVIDKALEQLHWNICSRVGVHIFTPLGGIGPTSGNSLFGPCGSTASVGNTLRALRFIVEAMGELPGRKSMVVFSDSIPREEQELDLSGRDGRNDNQPPFPESGVTDSREYSFLLQRVAERAIRSSVVIYAVDAGGLQYTGLTAADTLSGSGRQINAQINTLMSSRSRLIWQRREGADLIAKETGGFLVRNANDLGLDRISEDQSGYYLLGYRPSEETFDRRFHHIKAKVRRSGMSLRTRFGFYGITEDEANRAKRTDADRATIALMSPFGAQDIDLGLTAFFADDKAKGSLVKSFLYLDVKDLTFTDDAEGWHNATLELRGVIFGNNGNIVDQVTHGETIGLRGQTFQDALRDGISIQFDIPIKKAGSYQLRVSARDIPSGRIGAVGQFITIPDLKNKMLAVSGIVMRGVTGPNTAASPEKDSGGGPAIRRFLSGSNVMFTCVIYNAAIDPTNHLPNLSLQARLFHDGKIVYTTPQMKVDATNQSDPARTVANGFIKVDPALEQGSYYLQLTITDNLAKQKDQSVMQWIDFTIVK